jgi:hypothetical protein
MRADYREGIMIFGLRMPKQGFERGGAEVNPAGAGALRPGPS